VHLNATARMSSRITCRTSQATSKRWAQISRSLQGRFGRRAAAVTLFCSSASCLQKYFAPKNFAVAQRLHSRRKKWQHNGLVWRGKQMRTRTDCRSSPRASASLARAFRSGNFSMLSAAVVNVFVCRSGTPAEQPAGLKGVTMHPYQVCVHLFGCGLPTVTIPLSFKACSGWSR
jgi:hypothetical protein